MDRQPGRGVALTLARGIRFFAVVAFTVGACAPPATTPHALTKVKGSVRHSVPSTTPCGGAPLHVEFIDAGQGLAVLVTLPDGRQIIVDAGESPKRAGCGTACKAWHAHVMAELGAHVHGRPEMLFITHGHSDHVGGAPDVLGAFSPELYVDNGLSEQPPTLGTRAAVLDPERHELPLHPPEGVAITPILPRRWPSACRTDSNACSIALRVDYCRSSVLFTGDATAAEESAFDTMGPVTLLQVSHHGAEDASSAAFLARTRPTYAVISAGKPNEGTNRSYCHPRAGAVDRLTRAMGGPGVRTMRAFAGARCSEHGSAEGWADIPASDRLWLTARDGDVVLSTTGDGVFRRE